MEAGGEGLKWQGIKVVRVQGVSLTLLREFFYERVYDVFVIFFLVELDGGKRFFMLYDLKSLLGCNLRIFNTILDILKQNQLATQDH